MDKNKVIVLISGKLALIKCGIISKEIDLNALDEITEHIVSSLSENIDFLNLDKEITLFLDERFYSCVEYEESYIKNRNDKNIKLENFSLALTNKQIKEMNSIFSINTMLSCNNNIIKDFQSINPLQKYTIKKNICFWKLDLLFKLIELFDKENIKIDMFLPLSLMAGNYINKNTSNKIIISFFQHETYITALNKNNTILKIEKLAQGLSYIKETLSNYFDISLRMSEFLFDNYGSIYISEEFKDHSFEFRKEEKIQEISYNDYIYQVRKNINEIIDNIKLCLKEKFLIYQDVCIAIMNFNIYGLDKIFKDEILIFNLLDTDCGNIYQTLKLQEISDLKNKQEPVIEVKKTLDFPQKIAFKDKLIDFFDVKIKPYLLEISD